MLQPYRQFVGSLAAQIVALDHLSKSIPAKITFQFEARIETKIANFDFNIGIFLKNVN